MSDDEFLDTEPIPDERFSAFLDEYKTSLHYMEKALENAIQIIGFSTGALAAFVAYVSTQAQVEIPGFVAWAIPAACLIVYALIIVNAGNFISYLWSTRLAANRIHLLVDEIVFARYVPESPSGSFFSVSRGDWRFLSVLAVLMGAALLIYSYALYIGFQHIYDDNHFAGLMFIMVYVTLGWFEAAAIGSALTELPRRYRIVNAQLSNLNRMPSPEEMKMALFDTSMSGMASMLATIIPRHHDLIVKGPNFWFGFIAAIIFVGIDAERLNLMNVLFSGPVRWTSVDQAPWTAILGLGLTYFVVEELFLQQAKLIWNDIRDINRDRNIPHNRKRPIASGQISIQSAKLHMTWRLVPAFVFGYVIGGLTFTLILVVITLHQVLYEIWAKPRGGRDPILVLAILAFNMPLRFAAGAVAAAGSNWHTMVILALLVNLWFLSGAILSLQWRLEPENQRINGEDIHMRPQSEYFFRHGLRWQNRFSIGVVLVVACIIALVLRTDLSSTAAASNLPYVLTLIEAGIRNTGLMPPPSIGSYFTSVDVLAIQYANLVPMPVLASIVFVATSMVGLMLIASTLYLLLYPLRWLLLHIDAVQKARTPVILCSYLVAIFGIIVMCVAIVSANPLYFVVALMPLAVAFLFISQYTTYQDYFGETFANSLKHFARAANAVIFNTTPVNDSHMN